MQKEEWLPLVRFKRGFFR